MKRAVFRTIDTFFVSCERLHNPVLEGILHIKAFSQGKMIKGDMDQNWQLSHSVTKVIQEKAPVPKEIVHLSGSKLMIFR